MWYYVYIENNCKEIPKFNNFKWIVKKILYLLVFILLKGWYLKDNKYLKINEKINLNFKNINK